MSDERKQPLTVRSVGAPLLTEASIALLVALVAAHTKAKEANEKRAQEDKTCAA